MNKIKDKKRLVKLISFMVMGDGGLYYKKLRSGNLSKNPYFKMNMVEDNSDYVNFCKDVISNITNVNIDNVKKEGNRRNQLTIYTPTLPFFKKIHNRIYNNSYKGLDWHTMKQLDYESLAILYMCDGSFLKDFRPKIGMINPSYRVTLNLKRLSYGDTLLLKKMIKNKLNLEFNINKQIRKKGGYYYYLILRTKDVNKFMENIKPFILESFKYKII